MKKYFIIMTILLVALTSCAREENTAKEEAVTAEESISLPENFDVVPEEKLYEIINKASLDNALHDVLGKIGVQDYHIKAYGNYIKDDISDDISIFLVTDTGKQLKANALYFKQEWIIEFIKNTQDEKFYYTYKGIETVDIYDYKTGNLISKKNLSYEAYSEKMKSEQEEIDRKYHEELDRIVEEYTGKLRN